MWTLQDSLVADQLRHRRLPKARARVVADVDGGVGLSSQLAVPEGQHLLDPQLKYEALSCEMFDISINMLL